MRLPNTTRVQSVLIFLLCALFLGLAMGTALLGSGVYRNVTQQADENNTQRTALSLLTNQLRRSDVPGGIRTDGSRLILRTAQDDPYVTLLYCHEGQLMELYTEETLLSDFSPGDGTPLLPLQSLSIRVTERAGQNPTGLILDAAGDCVTLTPHCGFAEVIS